MKQFDFVLCKHPNDNRNFLFRAPAFSGLAKGDEVIVDTKYGRQLATVESCVNLDESETDLIDLIMTATGASKEIKKVISKVKYMNFEYED